jgi:hypothetical protein
MSRAPVSKHSKYDESEPLNIFAMTIEVSTL